MHEVGLEAGPDMRLDSRRRAPRRGLHVGALGVVREIQRDIEHILEQPKEGGAHDATEQVVPMEVEAGSMTWGAQEAPSAALLFLLPG